MIIFEPLTVSLPSVYLLVTWTLLSELTDESCVIGMIVSDGQRLVYVDCLITEQSALSAKERRIS